MGSSSTQSQPIAGIISRLAAEDWVIRRDAVREASGLLQNGNSSKEDIGAISEALDKLARDSKWEVRNAVALALQHLQHESFDRILSQLLEDAHFDVRRAAERTLKKRKRVARLGEWDELDALSTEDYEELLGKHLPPNVASQVIKLSQRWLELVVGASVHELRRILTPLKSRVSKAEQSLTPRGMKNAGEHLQRARERCDFMVRVLDSMEDWIGEGQRDLEFRKENVSEMVREALALVQEDFAVRSPKQKVRVDVDIDANLWVDAPRAGMIQAFRNIIQNSFEAIDVRGRIRISGKSPAGQALLEFSDNGCGMSDETRQLALRPFVSTKGSTGLGLAIAYRVIHSQCGGEIDFPEAKKGTTILVTLPINRNMRLSE